MPGRDCRRETDTSFAAGKARGAIAAEICYRTPVRSYRQCWRGVVFEFRFAVNGLTAEDREHAVEVFDVLFRHAEVIVTEHGEVGQHAFAQDTFLLLIAAE